MTLKDLMYLLFAIIVLYSTHFIQQYWRDEYEWETFVDRIFFLGKENKYYYA